MTAKGDRDKPKGVWLALEIERKYLVRDDAWRALAQGTQYRQGYLSTTPERTVRVRLIADKGYLTIKGVSIGAVRMEYEYQIPGGEAQTMLDELCEKPLIEKKRYKIDHKGLTWEVDEFFGENQGLIFAEVELESEDQSYDKPEWITDEVTGDPKYFNSNLIQNPYKNW